MPNLLNITDPLTQAILLGAGITICLALLGWMLSRWRDSEREARMRAELRRTRGSVEERQQALQRLATRIVATSSTGAIAGFAITRQIEAVFAEGQRSPAEAVTALKAEAAGKGANALINLHSQRLPSGKCVASGDAVIVRPLEEEAPPPPAEPSA